MDYIVLTLGLVGLTVFLVLKPRFKVLIALIVMTQGFGIVPERLYGIHIWDFGAVLLLIAALQLMFKQATWTIKKPAFVVVLQLFIVWLVVCFMYSIWIYDYPILDTFKVSRRMIIGYFAVFVFIRLFAVDNQAFDSLMKWLYIITFLLMIITIAQYIFKAPLLHGYRKEYGEAIRFIPSFMPFSLMFLWYILSKYFAVASLKKHEYVYAAMVVFVVANTYTRGIYLAVLFTFLAMLFLLFKSGKLKVNATIGFLVVSTMAITILTASGSMDRVLGRAASGIEILFSENVEKTEIDVDTFTGRLMLVKERFELVADKNPVIGFGFIHEENKSKKLEKSLVYGSIVRTPDQSEKYKYGSPHVLALYSVDIGWGNIVVATGLVGFIIYMIFIVMFLISYRSLVTQETRLYHFQLAFYLQTLVLLLLMFNGSTFTYQVQVPSLMIAGYFYSRNLRRNEKIHDQVLP